MVRLTYPEQLFNKIVRADYLPVDRTTYSERLRNLVDHLLIPDPNIRPKIDMVRFRFISPWLAFAYLFRFVFWSGLIG